MFYIANTLKGQVHVFAGCVKIVSHSSCRTSIILKYICPLYHTFFNFETHLNDFKKSVRRRTGRMSFHSCCKIHRQLLMPVIEKLAEIIAKMGLNTRKPVFGVCEQQRCRPACTSAQSDQHLCYSLNGKYHIQTCYKQYFNFLASLCS